MLPHKDAQDGPCRVCTALLRGAPGALRGSLPEDISTIFHPPKVKVLARVICVLTAAALPVSKTVVIRTSNPAVDGSMAAEDGHENFELFCGSKRACCSIVAHCTSTPHATRAATSLAVAEGEETLGKIAPA